MTCVFASLSRNRRQICSSRLTKVHIPRINTVSIVLSLSYWQVYSVSCHQTVLELFFKGNPAYVLKTFGVPVETPEYFYNHSFSLKESPKKRAPTIKYYFMAKYVFEQD